MHPGPREARQWLVLFVGVDLVGTDMYANVVNVQLKISDGIVELVDAVIQWGVFSMVLVQRRPQSIHHAKEPPKSL